MKRIALFWLVLLLALFAAAPGFAQLPKLDALLKGLEEREQFYGTVLVRKGGATVFQGTYGYSDSSVSTKTAPGSAYYITECGELFCGTLVMMAVDKGLMNLDAPIDTYVPAFRDKPGPRVRDLLAHTSGLVGRFVHTGDKPRTKAVTAVMAAEDGLAFPPGSRSSFNWGDFDILGLAVELTAGKPYPQLLSEWILAPLGLKQTGIGLFSEGGGSLAQVLRPGDWNYWLALYKDGSPSGDMYTSAGDFATFLESLTTGQLISKKTLDLMRTGVLPDSRFTGGKGKIGLGLYLTPSGALFTQGRLGVNMDDTTGYHALAFHDSRHDLSVILLANKWRPRPDARALDLVMPVVYADLGLTE